MKNSFRYKIAVFAALLFVSAGVLSAQQIKIADVTILPPAADKKPVLTTGQMVVGAKEVYSTPVNGSMVTALKAASTRAEQEDAILRFITPELRKKFEDMNAQEGAMTPPEEITPQTDIEEALKLATNKQAFSEFSQWGSSPFGKPATTWQELREHFLEYMDSVIERTAYSTEMKADWIDQLHKCLQAGPDGRFCKEVNVQDWPLWQWTTGRTAAAVRQGHLPGINIRYVGRSAKALWIALPRFGMAVMHGYECRGNPIVPYVGTTTFRLTKTDKTPEEPKIPQQCNCVMMTSNGQSGRVEIYPDQTVDVKVAVSGFADALQVQSEAMFVNGRQVAGNVKVYTLKPADFDFRLGEYNIEYRLTDQFGRTTICTLLVVIKPKPAPPVITKVIPPPVVPTTKLEVPKEPRPSRCGKGCKILIVAAVAGGGIGACAALGCFGGHKQTTPVPPALTKPGIGAVGPTSFQPGGVTISWGGGNRPRI